MSVRHQRARGISTQVVLPGRAGGVTAAAMQRLESARFLQRLVARDATLWSSDPTVQATIRDRLGWLEISRVMAKDAVTLQTLAHLICGRGLTLAVLLGMGGSGLFSEVCRLTFGVTPGGLDLQVLDTTDPTDIMEGGVETNGSGSQERGKTLSLFISAR